jgi:hypothetical protein
MSFLSARVARARLTASATATERVRELRASALGNLEEACRRMEAAAQRIM